MKTRLLIFTAVAITLAACGGGEPETPAEKQAQIEEYRAEIAELEEAIAELEGELPAELASEAQQKRVVVAPLQRQLFQHFVEVPAKVETDQNITVTPEVAGIVRQRLVEEGQQVRKGQSLLRLDSEIMSRQLDEINTRLSLSTTVYEKQKSLWDQEIGSEIQYLQAKNNMESLEKQRESLRAQMAKAVVKSPISGTVDEYFINPGEMATPGVPAARIVNLATIQVIADVSERYVRNVQRGDSVEITFTSLGQTRVARVNKVGQFINPDNRTFQIEMKLSNPDRSLKPNTVANVRINDYTAADAIVVPSFVLQKSTDGRTFVYIASKTGGAEVAKKVFVTVGKSFEGQTLIDSGLSPTDRIITKGYNDIVDGDKLAIVAPAPATASLLK